MTTKNPLLHEIIAVRKDTKSRVCGEVTKLHRGSEKEGPYTGMSAEYQPLAEDGEIFPAKSKKVETIAEDLLKRTAKLQTQAWNVEATQEWGNQQATADIVVDGVVIIPNAPVQLMLYLTKQIDDMRKFVDTIPTLDTAKDWVADPNSKLCRTQPVRTTSSKKIETPQVVIPPTEFHAGQWTTLTTDTLVGHWSTTHLSGALPVPRKEEILERLNKLRSAVKAAQSRANSIEVERKEVGEPIFNYILG